MEMALAGVTRTEANLGLLIRGLKHLAAGALAARDANTELTNQLDELRSHLMRKNEEEHALRFRMGQLEQLLDVIRHEGAREREFLIEQQDLFLVEILNDHERQVANLQRAITDAAPRAADARQSEIDALIVERAELIAQRDQARQYATRCESERDAAWAELAESEPTPAPVTIQRYATPPPLTAQRNAEPALSTTSEAELSEVTDAELAASRKSVSTAIGSISLLAVQVPASHVSGTSHERPSRISATSHERVSERPGTGYSLSGDDVAD